MRIRALFLTAALSLSTLLLGAPARAQVLGRSGDVSLAADRLMGFYLHNNGGNATAIGLGIPALVSPYSAPRLAFDFFIAEHLSFGGAIGYSNVDPEGRGDGYHLFLFSPRVGYAIDLSDSVGFWPRGGLTYYNAGDDNSELALTLEGMFWISIASHFAITVGPAIDLGIAGEGDETRSVGLLTMGVLGWF